MRPALAAFLSITMAAVLCWSPPARAQEERPSAMALFPHETVLFIRTADAREAIEQLRKTTGFQMARDPELAPFFESLRTSAQDAYQEHARDRLNVEFEDLTRLPQGELAFAIVERKGEKPAFLLLGDFREEVHTATQLLESAKTRAVERGGAASEEQFRADTVTTLRPKNDQREAIGVVQRGAVFVASTDPDLLRSVLDRWDGVPITGPAADDVDEEQLAGADAAPRYLEPLDNNRAFASSLRECLVGRDEPPQAIVFADPIGLFRANSSSNMGLRMGLAMLPQLGVDAIEGGAAAMWLATDKWDSLLRAHLLIDNPRTGAVRVVRLGQGDLTPPECVPTSIASYVTLHTDPQQIFDDIEQVVDRFTSEGRFREMVKRRVSDQVGVDIPDELLPLLTGRLTLVGGMDSEIESIQNFTFTILEVNDEEKTWEVLKKVVQKTPEFMGKPVEKTFGETRYIAVEREDGGRGPGPWAEATPVYTVMGGAWVSGFSESVLKTLIEAQEGTTPRLRDALQFKLVASRVKRLAGEHQVGVLVYGNPEASLRHWRQLAGSPDTASRLENAKNPFAGALQKALEAGEMPPIEQLTKYASPNGSVIYDTPTGFHYISFQFRPTLD